MDETGWLDALRQACTDSSQAAVARRLKVSPAMISQVLNGVYRGDMARIQGLIEGVYCQKPCNARFSAKSAWMSA